MNSNRHKRFGTRFILVGVPNDVGRSGERCGKEGIDEKHKQNFYEDGYRRKLLSQGLPFFINFEGLNLTFIEKTREEYFK